MYCVFLLFCLLDLDLVILFFENNLWQINIFIFTAVETPLSGIKLVNSKKKSQIWVQKLHKLE